MVLNHHTTHIDPTESCIDLKATVALKDVHIKMWHGHLPLFISILFRFDLYWLIGNNTSHYWLSVTILRIYRARILYEDKWHLFKTTCATIFFTYNFCKSTLRTQISTVCRLNTPSILSAICQFHYFILHVVYVWYSITIIVAKTAD